MHTKRCITFLKIWVQFRLKPILIIKIVSSSTSHKKLHLYVLPSLRLYVHTSLRLYVFTSIRPYVFTSLRLYVFTSLRPYVFTSLRPYVFTSLRPYVCTRIYDPTLPLMLSPNYMSGSQPVSL